MGMHDDVVAAINILNTAYNRRFGGNPATAPTRNTLMTAAWYNANNGSKFAKRVEYKTAPWKTVKSGQAILTDHLKRIQQVAADMRDNAKCESCSNTCSTVCTGTCVNGCSGCTGGCSGGCGSSCDGSKSHYNCSGCFTWCSGCSGACEGCSGGCRGGCARDCGGGCRSNCRSSCGGDCRNTCSNGCTSRCSNSARIGAVI